MYNYIEEKPELFTEKNQELFLRIRDRVKNLLDRAGAFRQDKAICGFTGDDFIMNACIDRLEELKEIKMVYKGEGMQYNVYVKGGN